MKKINNWFGFAQEDLLMAKDALKRRIYNQTCFHCQQGVEKTFKGFLQSHSRNIPRTHFLQDLLKLCSKMDDEFKTFKKECAILDDYYIPTRYPDALPGMLPEGLPQKKDAEEALETLRKIMDFVEKRLKGLE